MGALRDRRTGRNLGGCDLVGKWAVSIEWQVREAWPGSHLLPAAARKVERFQCAIGHSDRLSAWVGEHMKRRVLRYHVPQYWRTHPWIVPVPSIPWMRPTQDPTFFFFFPFRTVFFSKSGDNR